MHLAVKVSRYCFASIPLFRGKEKKLCQGELNLNQIYTSIMKLEENKTYTFLEAGLGFQPTNLYPDEIKDKKVTWVYCFNRDIEQELTSRSGKWMLFIPPKYIRECWDKIKEGVSSGNLSCAKTIPASRFYDVYATMIYTKDYKDKSDVARVLKYLISVGLKGKRRIYYKTDDQTRAGIYSGDKEQASTYSSDDFE